MLRIEPTLPMLRMEPVLPMLRIDPALPMLRMDPALSMLNTLPMLSMLPTLPKLKMLKRLLALIRPARFPAPARDRFFERAALCMTTSSYPGPYASSSHSSSIAGDLTPPERLAL
jgi:hypothetical protein